MLLIQIAAAIGIGFLTILMERRWKSRKKAIPLISSVAVVLMAAVTDYAALKLAEPDPKVTVIKRQRAITLSMKSDKMLSSVAVSIPVLGQIVDIQNFNIPTDALTVETRIAGYNSPDSQNHVVISATNVGPNHDLAFTILYSPMREGFWIEGADRYETTYSWHHGGSQYMQRKWFLINGGMEVDPPSITVRAARMYTGDVAEDSLTRHSKEGPPLRTFP